MLDYLSGRIYNLACNPTTGVIYEISNAFAQIQASVTMTTSATVAFLQSNLGFSGTIDGKGDLNVPFIRGIMYVSPKRVSIATASSGFVARAEKEIMIDAGKGQGCDPR